MKKTILIIDDDITFIKTMTPRLEGMGYRAIGATDGEKGFTAATTENPDLILLDIRMPALDGIGFLKKFREHQKGMPEIPVIITSNLSTMDYVSEGVTLGVKGYIVKSDETLDTIMREVDSILNPRETK